MGRKRRWWSKKAEKERERQERELAEKKAKDRADSEDRHEEIKVLWGLDDQQFGTAKNPKDRKLTEERLKNQKLKDLLKSIRNSRENDNLVDRISELIELVVLQDREIAYLMKFRRDWELIEAHYPDQLENLHGTSVFAKLQLLPKQILAHQTPKNWEYKRRRYNLFSGVGLIEYGFGGAGEAERRKHSLSDPFGLPYEPTCLDKIFGGGSVKMHKSNGEPGLQDLFGMHRNRFSRNLTRFKNDRNRRETLYDYRAVKEIMEALLSEEPRERKTPARGSPRRSWPTDSTLRTPMLSRIEARLNGLSVPEQIKPHIKAELLAIVHHYLPDSAKK
jgi:hypothetical protein